MIFLDRNENVNYCIREDLKKITEICVLGLEYVFGVAAYVETSMP